MVIVSKDYLQTTYTVGRLSDGSDRRTINVAIHTIQVDDGTGLKQLTFDHDPTEVEIEASIAACNFRDVTTESYRLQQQIDTLALEVLALKGV